MDEITVLNICNIVKEVSFKGAGVENTMKSIEGQIVQEYMID